LSFADRPSRERTARHERLRIIDHQFQEHRKRSVLKAYLIRFAVIVALLAFIGFAYAAWVVSNVQRILTSHKGVKEAKKVLVANAGDEPINILLLGADIRKNDPGRSDTIMILRIDPAKKRAVLLSIPRDSRVEIPGHGRTKINAAFSYGGAKLTIETVSQLTGLEFNHYAVVDMMGFIHIVDALGGIDIDVEKRIRNATFHYNFEPGLQHMDGKHALSYVRFRHDAEGDFGRIRRQQQFLKAIADRFLRIEAIPQYPRIANIAARYLETDMSITEMISLARLLASLPKENLETGMLPGTPKSIGGVSYVLLDEAKMKVILETVRKETRLPRANEMIDPSTIRLRVFNGTGTNGLARAGANYARDLGFRVIGAGDADACTYATTVIVYASGKQDAARAAQKALGFGEVKPPTDAQLKLLRGADVGLILGFDAENVESIRSRLP